MKPLMLALALLTLAPLARAQVVIQAPPIPGVTVAPSGEAEYWRRRHERDDEWRRRAEFRDEEHRREEWLRSHCVRSWGGDEWCRR